MKITSLTLGLLVLGCSGEADIGKTDQQVTLCDPMSCPDPQPLSPNYTCPDGTTAGPACVEASNATCGWQVLDCADDPSVCTVTECGPAPGVPNWTCADGTIAGPACGSTPNGCGWTIVDCPDVTACQWDDCPSPAPGAPNYQCPDGTIGGPACKSTPNGCGWTFVECPTN